MINIKSLRAEPYAWIHLSGIALVPVCLGVTTLAMGMGGNYPILELSLLAVTGILPILLMQLTRPFDIFSVLFLSLKPESLNEERKVILSLFKTFSQKLFSTIAAAMMLLVLWLLYCLSPLTAGLIDFLPYPQIFGSILGAIAFFAANLFLQVPLSVLLVLKTKPAKLAQTKAYPLENIQQDFTVPGIKVNKILWFLESENSSIETVES